VGVEAGAVVGEELPPGLRHVGGRGERKSEHALVQEDGEVEGPDPHWLDGVPHSGHIHIHSAGSLGGEQHLRREHLVDDGGGERAVGGLGAAIKEQSRSSHQRGNQGEALREALREAIREALREALREAIREALRETVRNLHLT
jgi:hypothetical protein